MSKTTSQTHNPDKHHHTDQVLDATAAIAVPPVETTTECVACGTAIQLGCWKGSIPRGYTHCRDCHTSFPSSNRWGHCACCHETFSGTVAWGLHQRTSGDGDIRSDCMCGVLRAGVGEAAPLGAHHQRIWAVSKSKSLVQQAAEWGTYWAQDTNLSGVFE